MTYVEPVLRTATIRTPVERRPDHDPIGLNRIMISSSCLSMISAQTLRVCHEGKPVPTHRVVARGHAFPDHALGPLFRFSVIPDGPRRGPIRNLEVVWVIVS